MGLCVFIFIHNNKCCFQLATLSAAVTKQKKTQLNSKPVYNNIFIGHGAFYDFEKKVTGCIADYNIIANIDGSAKKAQSEDTHGINGGVKAEDVFKDPVNQNFSLKHGPAVNAVMDLSDTGFDNDFMEKLDNTTFVVFSFL
jgi:hypothetical protein